MKWWKLPWSKHNDEPQHAELKERLERIVQDDDKVDRIARRAAKIVRENNFGPTIMNALGVRRG